MKLKGGEAFCVTLPAPEPCEAVPENIPIDIIYEDDDIIVVNKPQGMVVHPAVGNTHGTLVNALLYHCAGELSGIGGEIRPGIVHRIDKDTSGLLVVAKNDRAHRALAEQLEGHRIVREYHALVTGGLREDTGTVKKWIGRHPVDRKKMAILPEGASGARDAVTHYEVLMRFGEVSYLKLHLETGRTHQIRVHMASLGHPLLGDEVYGGGKTRFEKAHKNLFDGQALHARKLSFVHPTSGERVCFECPLPKNFEKALSILQKEFKE
jgi:23S rRNA pseudouridine1911/1915/1917 synthase